MKCFKADDIIHVFVAPRGVRTYRVRTDGSFVELNAEPKPLKTIDSAAAERGIKTYGTWTP